jgi:MauM/NapG family ferredoxin protein
MNARIWRRLRQITQVLALLLFVYLFIYATSRDPKRIWADVFYRLDPLIGLSAMLAGRTWIPLLGLSAVTLVLTLVFGRVWCGWICPLGTVIQWIRPRTATAAHRPPSDRWRSIKYVLLAVILVAALLGNQTLLFLDPMTVMTRTMATAVWPTARAIVTSIESWLYRFDLLWPALDLIHRWVTQPLFRSIEPVFCVAIPAVLFFLGILALNTWTPRFWCRYLCPLGGLLGLLSKLSLVRRTVSEQCAACALCTGSCPTGTIRPEEGYRSDPAECIVCYDCIVDCTRDGVAFRWLGGAWSPAEWRDYDPRRRELLGGAAAAVAGVVLTEVEPSKKRTAAHMIRPPGSLDVDFESLCVRCGECVRICPTQGLQPSLFEGGVRTILTPRLVPRLGYCSYSCQACGDVCPTGAIPSMALSAKQDVSIGLARVDQNRCLPWAYDIPCIVCEEACPVPDKAIRLEVEDVVTSEGESISIQRPYVVKDLCIGCGICEYQCPMEGEAAIRVYAPTELGPEFGF